MKTKQSEKKSEILAWLNCDDCKPFPKAHLRARYQGGVLHPKRKPDEQSRLTFYGFPVPHLRKRLRDGLQNKISLAVDLDPKAIGALFCKSQVQETRLLCLMCLDHLDRKHSVPTEIFTSLAAKIDNWPLADTLSGILARKLEKQITTGQKDHFDLQKLFQTWNKSENPWLRRMSLTSLLFYARFRKKKPKVDWMLSLVESRLEDPHYYVQKAVGWTLREIGRVNASAQKKFVLKNLLRIQSTAWFATSELYSIALRENLVKKRREQI